MEPAHPQGPDQLSQSQPAAGNADGAAPRPRSRRGWMSDSPLDGGSGWSTAAYAIIPRPVQPPPPAPAAPAAPPGSPARTDADPSGGSLRTIVVTTVVVLVLVGVIVAVVVARPLDRGRGTASDAAASPTAARTTDSPVRGNAGGGAGAGANASPSHTTTVLRTGMVRMTVTTGQPVDAFDLDAGVKGAPNSFGTGQQPDLAAASPGLTGLNGARFSPWTQPTPPTSAACGAIPAAQWSTDVLLAALAPRAVTCVRTSDDRFATLTVQAIDTLSPDQVYTANLAFTVWKKPGDAP